MTRIFASLTALLMTAAIAGCGGDDTSSSSSESSSGSATTPPAQTETTASGSSSSGELKIAADPSGALKFNTTALDAKAGKVTIVMDNPSPVPHAVSIEGNGQDAEGNTVEKGGKSKVSADLKPGKYVFYCPVDGHRQAGMKGDLTVK
jgi:plastocyanin